MILNIRKLIIKSKEREKTNEETTIYNLQLKTRKHVN